MSEFEGLGGKNVEDDALDDAKHPDGAPEDLGYVDDADYDDAPLEVGGGEMGEKRRATRGANAHTSSSSSNNGNGSEHGKRTPAASRARRTTAGVTKARDSPSKSRANSALLPTTSSSAQPPPTLSSSSITPPLPTSPPSPTEASAPAPKAKPMRAQPSGFAGISTITKRGDDGNLSVTTVKTEASQHPPKKRRRRPDPASMTDEQRIDRRERNREHAKRSRVRKKFLLESLQEQLLGLRGENTGLRQLVVDKCPQQKAEGILKNCMTEENFLLLESDLRLAAEETGGRAARQSNSASGGDAAAAGGGAASRQNTSRGLPDGVGGPDRNLTVPDYRLMLSLVNAQQNFTVSDPGLPDNPIVYASQGFLDLTGYSREQVLGRNCRFLQGPKTNPKMVDVIRKGVAAGDDTSVCLLNYKADGTTFWNQFFVAALRDLDGRVVNYVGVQCEVEASVAKQLPGIDNGTEEASGMSPPAPIQSFTNS